jgi:hypothetical protein
MRPISCQPLFLVGNTKRYHLGQLLSRLTRHFLLMTATPHNGKEEDFQLFLALLDGDRFEGRFRDGVHQVEVADLDAPRMNHLNGNHAHDSHTRLPLIRSCSE